MRGLGRFLFWVLVNILSVGTIAVDVIYTDGVHITTRNWWKKGDPQ